MFPVEDPALMEQVIHILEVQLDDNVKAHILQPDGTYEKIDKRGKVLVTPRSSSARRPSPWPGKPPPVPMCTIPGCSCLRSRRSGWENKTAPEGLRP